MEDVNLRTTISDIQYADGRAVKMSYNPLRHLQEVEDWLGITKINTDIIGRATKVTYPDGKQVKYQLGALGQRQSITYPDGRTVYYGYDQHLRLSDLRDGNQVVNYTYDEVGALRSKGFFNGMETSYVYNQKGQLTSLIHKDKEGVLDNYNYQYDLLGNKISIDKQRRGLEIESGVYSYDYDSVGRLSNVSKDGQLQRTYNYDAFGNRSQKREISGGTKYTVTNYAYNQLNQLMSMTDNQENHQRYSYDKRGNLTEVFKNNQLIQQYHYGTLNRLESTYNHERQLGTTYSYNGLGHRVGRVEGQPIEPILPTTKLNQLNLNPTKQVDDVIDLTRKYHNLLSRAEEDTTTNFAWDFNVVSASGGNGEYLNYYQDDLGSPMRLSDDYGALKGFYGYDEFGQDLYKDLNIQPFTYTGYQLDSISGTYFAQAREYNPNIGRFTNEDLIKGFAHHPFTLNPYSYCWSQPMNYIDSDGELPFLATAAIGAAIGAAVAVVGSVASDLANGNSPTLSSVGYAAAAGAIAGAVIGSGVGLVAGVVTATAGAVAGTAAVATMTTAIGVGTVYGGVTSHITGGNTVNGMIGGAWNGFVTSAGVVLSPSSALGLGPGAFNFAGGFTGSVLTNTLDNIFADSNKSILRVVGEAALSGILQWGLSGAGAMPWGVHHGKGDLDKVKQCTLRLLS